MKLFQCQSCAQLVHFENTICEKCGHQLGFIPEITNMTSIEPKEAGIFEPMASSALVTATVRTPISGLAIGWSLLSLLILFVKSADTID
jgi:zinc-ribbon domain